MEALACVLIVEDSVGARNLAVRMLISIGYTVVAAKDAAEAIALLDQGQEFDVLFTDIIMPGPVDGIALAHIVHGRRPQTKIMFTSGFSSMNPDDLAKLNAIYVAKPYRKAEIAGVLSKLLKDTV